MGISGKLQILISIVILAYGLTVQNGLVCIVGIAIVMEIVIRIGMNEYYERNKPTPDPTDTGDDYIMD